eukprot:tig00020616_g12266.t1
MACTINFRGPSGHSIARFDRTATLSDLRRHVRENILKDVPRARFKLATTFPVRILDDYAGEVQLSVVDMELTPTATLVIRMEEEEELQPQPPSATAAAAPARSSAPAPAPAAAPPRSPRARAAAAAAAASGQERLAAQFEAEARRRGRGGPGADPGPFHAPPGRTPATAGGPGAGPRAGPSYADILLAPVRGIAELFSPSNLAECGRSLKELAGMGSGGGAASSSSSSSSAPGAPGRARTATLADLPAGDAAGRTREGAPQRVPGSGLWQFGPNPELERHLRQTYGAAAPAVGAGGEGGGGLRRREGAGRAFGNEAHSLADVRARRGEAPASGATQQVVMSGGGEGEGLEGDEPHIAAGGFGPISGIRTAWRALKREGFLGSASAPAQGGQGQGQGAARRGPGPGGRGGANIHGLGR